MKTNLNGVREARRWKTSQVAPPLSREQELVLACISLDPAKDEQINEILANKLDWQMVSQIARRQGVFPLFYQRMTSVGEKHITPSELSRWKTAYIAISYINLLMTQQLVGLLDLFSGAGIKCIPLKGPISAIQAYGDLGMRQFEDLDLLIHREDFEASYALLVKNGYTPLFEIESRQIKWLIDSDHHFLFAGQGINLEVHWDISPPGFIFPFKIAYFWEGLDTIQVLEKEIFILSPENSVLMACLHGTKHRWNKLNLIADLSYLIQAYPGLDWNSTIELATRAGFLRPLCLSLQLAEDPGGVKLPSTIHELAQANQKAQSLASDVRNKLLTDWHETSLFGDTAYYFKSRERLRHRFYYAFDQIFIPKQTEWKDLPLPDPFTPLYYLIRPFRLLFKFGWVLLTTPFKD